MLLAAPTLQPVPDQIMFAGAPLYVALSASDPDGDLVSFSAEVTQSQLSHPEIASPTLMPILNMNNRNLRLEVGNFGEMVFELFEQWAPRTTSRIIELAQQGFYNGLTFHRIIQNFVIQGGDPTGTGAGGSGVPFDDEYHPYLMHTGPGILSMAKSTDDTNDSQFFITSREARHLDFNHSVFGFLVRGEDVRQQIAAVPVDGNNRPLQPVVISSAEVLYDRYHRALVLLAPLGTTGSAEVKVTVRDTEGNVVEQRFTVTLQTDPWNSNAYLGPIPPIWTQAGLPVSQAIPAYDREGNVLIYAATPGQGVTDLTVQMDPSTGVLTITPQPGAVGVRSVVVAVGDPASYTADAWDRQEVPVYIRPAPPAGRLTPEADTGVSNSDRLTRLNNTPNAPLRFDLSELIAGAEVSVLIDDVVVATGTATSTTLSLQTTGTFPLSDGPHKVTFVQVLRDRTVRVGNLDTTVTLWSDESAPLWITVDTVAPVFTSMPPVQAAEGMPYEYLVQVVPEVTGPITFELLSGPPGMSLNAETGLLRWQPGYNQAGTHLVIIQAIDAAGNSSQQSFQIEVVNAPDVLFDLQQTLREQQAWELALEAVAEHPPVVWELLGPLPAGMTFDTEVARLRWTPGETQGPGLYEVNLRVVDAAGLSRLVTLQLQVEEANLPPRLLAVDEVLASEHQAIELQLVAEDDDLPSQTLIFSLQGAYPEGMTLDPNTGILHWLPSERQGPGEYSVRVRVTDSEGGFDDKLIHFLVREEFQAPQWEPVAPLQLEVGGSVQLPLRAVDPDVPALPIRYRLAGTFGSAAVDPESGVLSWTLSREEWELLGSPAEVRLVVEAYKVLPDDGGELTSRLEVPVTILNPVAAAIAAYWEQTSGTVETRWGESRSLWRGEFPWEADTPGWTKSASHFEKSDWSDSPGPQRSFFSGITGWLARPSGAIGVSDEVLRVLDLIEEDLLRGRIPKELLEKVSEFSAEIDSPAAQESLAAKIPAASRSQQYPSHSSASPQGNNRHPGGEAAGITDAPTEAPPEDTAQDTSQVVG
jgi:cyclophilin family peptidyl-prolyl cis-trans isomerase